MRRHMRRNLRLLLLLLVLITASERVSAGGEVCLLQEIPMEQKLSQASLVFEGSVLQQTSFWNENRTMIFTLHEIQVLKLFKGEVTGKTVAVITEGGTVGSSRIEHSATLQLYAGQKGTFFCVPNNFKGISAAGAYEVFGSMQGFVGYDHKTGEARGPFEHFKSFGEWRHQLTSATGQSYRVISEDTEVATAEMSGPEYKTTAQPTITSFTPAQVTGGTGTLLTINGNNFGAIQGTGYVAFPNANDGGATYVRPVASDYLLWSDNQIVLRVPSNVVSTPGVAGSGNIRVTNNDPATAISTTPLTIIYTHTNINDNLIAEEPDLVDDDNSGGYTLQFGPNFSGNTAAITAFTNALDSWCPTFMNWKVGNPTNVNVAANDGVNVVRFDVGSELPAGTAGRLTSYYTGCGPVGGPYEWSVSEMDIVFDDAANWNFGPAPPAFTEYDFESVVLHELGHGLQLNHVIDPSNVMHYNILNGQMKRTLSVDDITGGLYVVTKSTLPNTCGAGPMTVLNCVLPVRLLEFEGRYAEGEGAVLNWEVTDEGNIEGYHIERSIDGALFEELHLEPAGSGSGGRQYS